LPINVGNLLYLYGVTAVYLYGVTAIGPVRAAVLLYLSLLFSATFAIGWLGERIAYYLGSYHVTGTAVIVARPLASGAIRNADGRAFVQAMWDRS
jgi:drug/metabolite transporter (DMT)-like permease